MNKRAIIILAAIFVLIVATLGIILYMRKGSTTPTTNTPALPGANPDTNQTNTNNSNTSTTPQNTSSNGVVKLITDQVVSPVLFYRGDGITYFTSNGQLFQVDMRLTNGVPSVSNQRRVEISAQSNITKILWPATGNNFIAQLGSGTTRRWSFYDSSKQQYIDLPSQITSLSWLPDGINILYIWKGSDGKATLNISKADGTAYKKLADMYNADSEITISPDGKNVLFYRSQNTSDANPIILVSSDGKFFKTVIKDGFNSGVLWSPDNHRFLFTRRDVQSGNMYLWVGNIQNDEVKSLGLAGSIDKAVWSADGSQVYVASVSTGVQESIYKFDTTSFSKTEVVNGINEGPIDLFLSQTNDAIFFRATTDGMLYGAPFTKQSSSSNNGSSGTTPLPILTP